MEGEPLLYPKLLLGSLSASSAQFFLSSGLGADARRATGELELVCAVRGGIPLLQGGSAPPR